ncbi:unnamed protein product, partial [Strongylus vulgaris]
GFASPPCYDGPLSAAADPDATGPTLVTVRGFESPSNTVPSPVNSSKESGGNNVVSPTGMKREYLSPCVASDEEELVGRAISYLS